LIPHRYFVTIAHTVGKLRKRHYIFIFTGLLVAQLIILVVTGATSKKSPRTTVSDLTVSKATVSIQPSASSDPLENSDTSTSVEVSFDENLNLNGLVREEIILRVINPYTDYYKNSSERVGLLSLFVQKNDSKDPTLPYTLASIFQNGRNEMIYIRLNDGDVKWWMPECLYTCPFPPGFAKKYPEIVKNFE